MDNTERLRMKVDYELQEFNVIGKGSYGEVFSGFLRNTGETICIKKGNKATFTEKRSLKKEYETLKGLYRKAKTSLPNIVNLHGWDEDDNSFFIIMERAKYSLGSLLETLPYKRGLPAKDMIKLVVDLGRAFSILSKHEVTHRDIKPANILVFESANHPSKSQFIFKLCDFGDAREYTEIGCHSIVGTKAYAHPIIHARLFDKKVTTYKPEQADMWSMAITLSEAATGGLPWPPVDTYAQLSDLYNHKSSDDISAAHNGSGGFSYFNSLRTPSSYPRWLKYALISLIRSQYNKPSYEMFGRQCSYIAAVTGFLEEVKDTRVCQKRLILLPTFKTTMHVDVDNEVFPKASYQEDSLTGIQHVLGIDTSSRTVCLTHNGIIRFEAEEMLSVNGINEDVIVVWNEKASGLERTSQGDVLPPISESADSEPCIEKCVELNRQCEVLIDAHSSLLSVVRSIVLRIASNATKLLELMHAVELDEERARVISILACRMQPEHDEMIRALETATEEMHERKGDAQQFENEMQTLVKCTSHWTELHLNPIENWDASLRTIIEAHVDKMKEEKFTQKEKYSEIMKVAEKKYSAEDTAYKSKDRMEIYAETLRRKAEKRMAELKKESENHIHAEEGIAHVIRAYLKIDSEMKGCSQKVQDTSSLINKIADRGAAAMKSFLETDGAVRKIPSPPKLLTPDIMRNIMDQAALVEMIEEVLHCSSDTASE